MTMMNRSWGRPRMSCSGSKTTRSASRPAGDRAFASGEADELSGVQGHPARQVGEREPALARRRPDGRQRQLERRDAAPRSKDVARVQVLELRRSGRVVRADRVDQTFTQALPQPFAILTLSDRRRALEARVAVGDLFGGEREVMGTGLDGQRQALAACLRDHGQRIGRRQVNDMDVAAKLAAKIDHEPDRGVLPLARSRCQMPRVAPARRPPNRSRHGRIAGQLRVHQQGQARAGELGHDRAEVGLRDVRKLVDSRVAEKRLEAEHARRRRAARPARSTPATTPP